MHRRPSAIPIAGWLIAAFAVSSCPSCGRDARPDPRTRLPDAQAARRAVERALAEWRDSPPLDLTTPTARPVMFVDQQRRPGRRLREFVILGEAEAEGCRRFQVRLSLADPDESVRAAYYVFGEGPVWVYRAEDFDMIMHMDKSMMPAPDPSAGAPGSGDTSGPGPGPRDRDLAPTGEAAGRG
jgi:hypothetical protein